MKLHKYTLDNFSGGFNSAFAEDATDSSCTQASYNVTTLGGSLKTVKGYTSYISEPVTFNSVTYAIVQLMVLHNSNNYSASKLLAAATNGSSRAVFLYDSGSWTRIQGALAEEEMSWINYNYNAQDYLIFSGGMSGTYMYNGTGNASVISDVNAPGARGMTLHYDRIWGVGDYINPSRIYYSAESNPTNWTPSDNGAGYIDIPTYDGDALVGVASVFDDVIIFKRNSIFRVSGTSPARYQLKKASSCVGCVSNMSIACNGSNCFYTAEDGIYRFDGIKSEELENGKLRGFFREHVNKSGIKNACSICIENKLYAAVPTDGKSNCNTVIEYDLNERAISIRKNISITSFLSLNGKLLFSSDDNAIYIYGEGNTDAGEEIEAHYETPYTDLGAKNIVKSLDSIYVTAKGTGNVMITIITEMGSKTRTFELKSADYFNVYCIPIHFRGRRFKFCFDNVEGSQFEIIEPEFYFEYEED